MDSGDTGSGSLGRGQGRGRAPEHGGEGRRGNASLCQHLAAAPKVWSFCLSGEEKREEVMGRECSHPCSASHCNYPTQLYKILDLLLA